MLNDRIPDHGSRITDPGTVHRRQRGRISLPDSAISGV